MDRIEDVGKEKVNQKAEENAGTRTMPKQTIDISKTKEVEPQTNTNSKTGLTIININIT